MVVDLIRCNDSGSEISVRSDLYERELVNEYIVYAVMQSVSQSVHVEVSQYMYDRSQSASQYI